MGKMVVSADKGIGEIKLGEDCMQTADVFGYR